MVDFISINITQNAFAVDQRWNFMIDAATKEDVLKLLNI